MEAPDSAQILVLGAGPAGCAVATVLARAGRDVLIVDACPSPLSAVGESLLPFGTRVLELMGVSMEGFQVKRGAIFTRGDDVVRFDFSESARPRWSHAWEVERDDLDARLRAAAAEAGARFAWARARHFDQGVLQTDRGPIRAGFFVDAAGRRKFLARQLGEIDLHAVLRNAAQHGRFRGVRRHGPEQQGDIGILGFEGGWFWFIPFSNGTSSVGMVTRPDSGLRGDRWAEGLRRCRAAAIRLEGAEPLGELRGLQNFTSYARRFHGPGWALVGDAALFLDPVFSSGVMVALETGWSLGEALRDGADLDTWEAGIRRSLAPMEEAVLAYYDGSFLDLAFAPGRVQKPRFRKQIVSLLAGDLFMPGNEISRQMAGKLPWLAGLTRQLLAHGGGSDESSESDGSDRLV